MEFTLAGLFFTALSSFRLGRMSGLVLSIIGVILCLIGLVVTVVRIIA
jgi:hypothetical protein